MDKKEKYRNLNEPPHLTILEEIGNAVTHGLGAALAIVAFVFLLLKSNSGVKVFSSCVYGISLIFLMLMSCLYHSFKWGTRVKRIWRRFDYCSIYLLIGGTFAPILLVFYGNKMSIIYFCIQWGLILMGITCMCILGPGRVKWLPFLLYFTIGWSGLVFIPSLWTNNRELFWTILTGGVIYTLGMIPFAKDRKGDHFIWHFFVLIAAIIHWFGIYLFIY